MRELDNTLEAVVTHTPMPRSATSPSVVPTVQKSTDRSRRSVALIAGLAATLLALLSTSAAQAASLQQVNNWGAAGVPADISMWVYVPDKVVNNPPVLTLVHYCGGTA